MIPSPTWILQTVIRKDVKGLYRLYFYPIQRHFGQNYSLFRCSKFTSNHSQMAMRMNPAKIMIWDASFSKYSFLYSWGPRKISIQIRFSITWDYVLFFLTNCVDCPKRLEVVSRHILRYQERMLVVKQGGVINSTEIMRNTNTDMLQTNLGT